MHWQEIIYAPMLIFFTTLSEDYTKEYGNEHLTLISAAQVMPDASQRRGAVIGQSNELDNSSTSGVLFWKKPRRYIMKAFEGHRSKAAIAHAGCAHHAKAAKGNWAEITEPFTAGQTCLETNAAMLTEKAKMPATFVSGCNKAKAVAHSITVSCPGFDTYTGVVKTNAGVKIELVEQTVAQETAEVTFTRETALEP